MVSEIGNSPPPPMQAGPAPAMTAKRTEDSAAPAIVVPKANDVRAPKPNDVKFDPVEAHKNLQDAVSMLNEQISATKQGLGFSYDDSKHQPVIKVSNIATGEVIRQIPSEDVLHMAHQIDQLKGILYNKAA